MKGCTRHVVVLFEAPTVVVVSSRATGSRGTSDQIPHIFHIRDSPPELPVQLPILDVVHPSSRSLSAVMEMKVNHTDVGLMLIENQDQCSGDRHFAARQDRVMLDH